jgi:hypothetical protein
MSPVRTAITKLLRGNERESRGHMMYSSGSEVGRGTVLAIDSDESRLQTFLSLYFCCLLSPVEFVCFSRTAADKKPILLSSLRLTVHS